MFLKLCKNLGKVVVLKYSCKIINSCVQTTDQYSIITSGDGRGNSLRLYGITFPFIEDGAHRLPPREVL